MIAPLRIVPPHVGGQPISEKLRAFVEEIPYERGSILAFSREVADLLPPGAAVLDVGAGSAQYKGLFEHCEYLTTEWDGCVSGRIHEVDLIGPPEALPCADATRDAVLLTHRLDRAPDPGAVLREAARVLRPGGNVFLTVPFVRQLAEPPSDLWRLTPASLERLLANAGFVDTRSLGSGMGRTSDGRDGERDQAAALLVHLAERLAALASLDVGGRLPLGWTAKARRA